MAQRVNPGELVELAVDGLDQKGRGVGDLDGLRVAVRRALPGDRVEVRLRRVRRRRGEAEGVLHQLLDTGEARTTARCSHFGICGGCLWQDVPYERQVALKEKLVRDALASARIDVTLGETLRAEDAFFYRNKMEFSIGSTDDTEMAFGLHYSGRFNRIFDLEACHLQSDISNAVVSRVRGFSRTRGLSAYDLKTHEGLLRFLTVREGKASGEVMVILTTSGEPFPEVEVLAEELQAAFPAVRVFVQAVNERKAQVATGDRHHLLTQSSVIEERLGRFTFNVSPESFFQPNATQAARMFDRVVALAELSPEDRALDLYCGTGAISLYLSDHVREVLGIEVAAAAVEDAGQNAARNGVTNCRFLSGSSEDILDGLREAGDLFDVAVTDPPRAGMHARALAALAGLGPRRIVYVSCNPVALARDLALFGGHGYQTVSAELVDMLPHTPHCEVLAVLERQGRVQGA